jgi:hypothetical protein
MLRTYLFISIAIFTIILSGCGAGKEIRGPLFLEPAPPPVNTEGFKVSPDGEINFEALSVKFILKPLRSVRESDPKLIQALVADGFIIIDMEIINMNENGKVMFNPSMSALRDNRSGYKKPLEYTALYQVAMRKRMERTLNRELKGRFFDTNEIVRAGKKINKFLIFTPYTGKGKKANLILQEVYIGNETIRITFPFLLTEGE